jgi:hypothetical protein
MAQITALDAQLTGIAIRKKIGRYSTAIIAKLRQYYSAQLLKDRGRNYRLSQKVNVFWCSAGSKLGAALSSPERERAAPISPLPPPKEIGANLKAIMAIPWANNGGRG